MAIHFIRGRYPLCSDFVPDETGRVFRIFQPAGWHVKLQRPSNISCQWRAALSQGLMAFINCIIGFLTAISSINEDVFQITSVSPNYLHNESVVEGGTFTLACSVNKYIRSCAWQHREPSITDVILLEIFDFICPTLRSSTKYTLL